MTTFDVEQFATHIGNALQFLKDPGGKDSSGITPTGDVISQVAQHGTQNAMSSSSHGTGDPTAYPSNYSYSGGGGGASDFDPFYTALLSKLNLPQTDANMAFLRAWNQAEGMQPGTNNPFATTQGAAGASNFNSVGVKVYPSFDTGVEATAQTLQNGYYGDILGAMQAGNDPMAAAVAVANSPWGTGSLVMGVLGG